MNRLFAVALVGFVCLGLEHQALAQNRQRECVAVIRYPNDYGTHTKMCSQGSGQTDLSTTINQPEDIILLSVVKELRAQNALIRRQNQLLQQQITAQAQFQSRLETDILAQQKTERELVTKQLSEIPSRVASDTRVIKALAAAIASAPAIVAED